jgi:capsular polysaccharide biosynthesis protein
VTLRDYVRIVARSWIVVAVSVALGLGTAGIVASTSTATYTSSAEVLFSGYVPTGGQDQAYFSGYVQSRMATYAKLAGSTSLLKSAADAIGDGETAAALSDRTTIDVSDSDTVATISVADSNAKAAARAADAVADALLEGVYALEPAFAPESTTAGNKDAKGATIQGVITREAAVPSSPSGPSLILQLLAGLLLGLLVSIGVIAFREALRGDDRPSSAAEGR